MSKQDDASKRKMPASWRKHEAVLELVPYLHRALEPFKGQPITPETLDQMDKAVVAAFRHYQAEQMTSRKEDK